MDYISKFESLGFGLFVHFGAYSVLGKGEWCKTLGNVSNEQYEKLIKKFNPLKTWAKDVVSVAKNTGCRYITLTTRHHDGFSLYDTKGLSTYDSKHTIKRDLIKEFVDECNKQGIIPFFYHTLLDWHNEDYKNNFKKYIDYLVKSIKILCTNYGKVGGFWFDGMWDKPNEDWQEDRIYATIRKYQPTAMIINNTGLNELGKVGHKEIDSVTFERGSTAKVDNSDRERAGEMCQVLNDHWGYAKDDCNYKSVKSIINDLIDCRVNGCNFLLNTGLKGNGKVNEIDKYILLEVGKWIKKNKNFIYKVKPCEIKNEGADILYDGKYYYAIIKEVGMSADPNVQRAENVRTIKINEKIKNAVWLDSNEKVEYKDKEIIVKPFKYGTSLSARVIKFKI